MSDIKITDLVDQETINKVKELDTEIQTLLGTYTNTAKELAKGLDINVKVVGDIDKLEKILVEKSKEASETTERLNSVMREQSQVISNTTNTISRQLMEQERVNKTQRESYNEYDKVKKLLEDFNGSYDDHLKRLVSLNNQITANNKEQKENEKALKEGKKTMEGYTADQIKLVEQHRSLTQEKRTLQQIMTAEEKAMQTADNSYVQMSQQLELLKKSYKDLSLEAREGELGQEMESAIQNLDAHLKDLAADMGEFQRNVGNYAIAGQNGVVATESVIAVLNQESRTTQDLIDQTKILEEAKVMLNKEDKDYESTLNALNSKLEENKRKLTDVSDIVGKEAKSVAEAEAQNKRLQEAIKHVDLSALGAKERIAQYREQIERNKRVIDEATGSNEKFADSMFSLIGVNSNFGSSLMKLESRGSFIDGMNTKVKAFGQTLMGLLSNPWVLTFLGIAGAGAVFKWWYDYNKGLVEASKLTANFTGETGKAADKITADMQAIADHAGKGFDETISAANKLVQYFGKTWEESMQLMEDGMIAGANMSGDMIANIERFAPAMNAAGVSAEEFMAILSETRNGIFDEKGIEAITKAGGRLRTMTKQTEQALDAVGISSKKMQKDLEEGNITMFQAVQQVAQKLKELPENSQEAGAIMKNVFSRTAAEGGTLLIQSIADVNTNLDECKANMGTLGEVTERQMKAQKELNETLVAVFKMGGTSFEEMTGNAKAFVNEGLTKIIRKGAEVYNWLVDLYNETLAYRSIIGGVKFAFVALYDVGKGLFELMIEGWRGTAVAVKGLLQILSGDFEKGWETISVNAENHFKNIGKIIVKTGKEIGKDFMDGINESIDGRMEKINFDITLDGNNENNSGLSEKEKQKILEDLQKNKELTDKEKKELEKAAQEQLRLLQQLDESKIALIQNSHEKELATIRLNYRKKIEAIKGDGENEKALRIQLLEQMENDLIKCEEKYQVELSKINLSNRLASAKKGSKEELDIKIAMLEQSRKKEIEEAEKTGADVNLVNEKYNYQRLELEQSYSNRLAQKIQERYAIEEISANESYSNAVNRAKERYAAQLKLAEGNKEQQEKIQKELDDELFRLDVEYTSNAGEAAIDMIEEILNLENLSAEDRMKWEKELTRAKISFANQVADANQESVRRQIADDEKLKEKRAENLQTWLGNARETLNNIGSLVDQLFSTQLENIEYQQEVSTEAGEKEKERIADLVEQNVITEEEGEARKRAAEEKTAKKNEELERKKAEIKRKQAIFDKALSVANIGLNTAMALMKLWVTPGWPAAIPMMAVVATLGALQLATALATPIPKYASGTDNHPGGLAIVGDGGESEVIVYDNNSWITPKKPTLVNMPEGAKVYPSMKDYDKMVPGSIYENNVSNKMTPVIVNNNYQKLEEKMDKVIYLFYAMNRKHIERDAQAYIEMIKLQKGL